MTRPSPTNSDHSSDVTNIPEKNTNSPSSSFVPSKAVLITSALGLMSATLYMTLFHYDAQLRNFASETQHGHKAFFLIPIAVAFVFTLVHGTFTDRFFDTIGFKPKKK